MERAKKTCEEEARATIFGCCVQNLNRYGVVDFDEDGQALSIEEKSEILESNFSVTDLYFYPNKDVEIAKKITPSKRGELEITSINEVFLKEKELNVELMGRGFAWLDTGTNDSLLEASNFI